MSEGQLRMADVSPVKAWFAVVVLMFTFAVSILDRTIINLLVAPIEADLGITDTQMGLIQGFALAFFFAVAGLPIGRLADLTSRKRLIAIGITVWSLATIFSGLSKSFLHLFVARMVVGVGEAVVNPGGFSMLADMFPKERLGRAVAVFASGSFVGIAIAFFFGGLLLHFLGERPTFDLPLVGQVRNWQVAFFAAGIPGFAVALLVLCISEPTRQGAAKVDVPISAAVGFLKEAWKPFCFITLGFSCLTSLISGSTAWIPTLLIRKHHLEHASIGGIMGLAAGVFGFAGYILGGILCDYFVKRGYKDAYMRMGVIASLASAPFAIAATLSTSLQVTIPCVCLFFLLLTTGMAAGVAGLQLMTPYRLRGQMSALFTLLTNLIGLSLGSLFIGVMNDHVFGSKDAIDKSLLCLYLVFLPLMCAMFFFGRKSVAERVAYQEIARRDV